MADGNPDPAERKQATEGHTRHRTPGDPTMSKFTDITHMTDAALDVFLAVKAGEDVVVEHLSPVERQSVCDALGVRAPIGWLCGDSTGGRDVPRGPRVVHADVEALILDRQDAFYNE